MRLASACMSSCRNSADKGQSAVLAIYSDLLGKSSASNSSFLAVSESCNPFKGLLRHTRSYEHGFSELRN